MTDLQVAPEWMAQVQETFLKLRCADRKAQEDACNVIGELPDGGEAAATLMELFETERAKNARLAIKGRAAPVEAGVVEAKPQGKPQTKRDANGNLYRLTKWGYRRVLGGGGGGVVVALKPTQQAKPEPAKPEPEPEDEEPKKAAVGDEEEVEGRSWPAS